MPDPIRILVITQDPSSHQLINRVLTERGFQVEGCSDATGAMGVLKQAPYRCVLLEIPSESSEGTELVPILKHNFPQVPIVLLSAFPSGPLDASYLNSLGAFEVVKKPFDNALLVDIVNRAVGLAETIPLVLTSLSLAQARDQAYRRLIVTALRRSNWNQSKAATLLGVSRYSLIRWLHKLNIVY
jgi:DNA-binding NtrC family response regulator